MAMAPTQTVDFHRLVRDIRTWGRSLGFDQVGITGIDLADDERRLLDWLAQGRHGAMHYMEQHGTRRSRPADLVAGTLRVISVRMNYLPRDAAVMESVLADPALGYIARYALGRDYHRLMRTRLQALARYIESVTGAFGYRAFADSAPVLEKPLARNAGLGWIGKHTNLVSRDAGSWFFLGELYTDLPLPPDAPATDHCGRCRRCIDACPTGAIVAPYELDARRCIAYLTIELRTSIPVELRPLIGNRIFGCDDCQAVCPWNRFAPTGAPAAFTPRHGLDAPALAELLGWSEEEFLHRTEGSALRRIGYECWLRNIAVALGNAPHDPAAVAALTVCARNPSALVREHVHWALERQQHAPASTAA